LARQKSAKHKNQPITKPRPRDVKPREVMLREVKPTKISQEKFTQHLAKQTWQDKNQPNMLFLSIL
jgi:hypothetical protein